jgi:hypothetical protein
MRLPDTRDPLPQWGDGFEIETLINVRVAANRLQIAEVCSYEANRIHGVSNLNAVRDGTRVLRTIRREFFKARATVRADRRYRVLQPMSMRRKPIDGEPSRKVS